MTGILYGTGVGPGDPELMTLKSVRLIRENRVIALPGPVAAETIAYRIAVQAVPELASKTLLSIDMPMTHDQKRIAALGYGTELVSGITSFCAAAARTGTPLAEWDEQLHILPAVHRLDSALDLPGNYVLMKSGRKMQEVKKCLLESGRDVVMVENCGMENEHIYRGADAIPDDAGYYSLIIAKEPKGKG